MLLRVRPRFFDQVVHETIYASNRNKHFFKKLCHCQTDQNYEQPPRTSQNSYFQDHFSVLKIGRIFPKKILYEEYLTMRPTFINFLFFLKILMFKVLYFLKLRQIFVGSVHNFGTLTMTRFSEKCLCPLDEYMVLCPT